MILGAIAPERLRDICGELSLDIVLTHVSADRLMNETEKVIAEHKILGCKYIGIGGMPDKYLTAEWYEYFAADFREPAKKIADAGHLFMYHNHNFKFAKIAGKGYGCKRHGADHGSCRGGEHEFPRDHESH
jgi:hypothetical protein